MKTAIAMKDRIFVMPAVAGEMPVKLKMPAITEVTKKISAHFSKVIVLVQCGSHSVQAGTSRQGKNRHWRPTCLAFALPARFALLAAPLKFRSMVEQFLDAALMIVADGGKAILFRAKGAGDGLSLHEKRRLSPKNLADEGPSGSRPGEQTERHTNEATFAKQLAHLLYAMRHRDDYSALVLVADPQTLGQLRGCMHKTVEASIVRTMAKDLTNLRAAGVTTALGR